MKRALALPLLALVAAGGSGGEPTAAPAPSSPGARSCGGHHHGATHGLVRHDRLLERAWKRRDYTDDEPRSKGQRARLEHFRRCARGDRVHRLMREHATEARRAYRRWQERLEFRAAYTPFFFGEPTLRWSPIPAYIVRCETNGYYGEQRWFALSPGGHSGPFQIDVSLHGVPHPADTRSEREQHIVKAAGLWAGGAGASHWSCA